MTSGTQILAVLIQGREGYEISLIKSAPTMNDRMKSRFEEESALFAIF
jgi:hypothetical protein